MMAERLKLPERCGKLLATRPRKLPQRHPKLSKFGRTLPILTSILPTLGQYRPILDEFCHMPMSNEFGRTNTQVGQKWPDWGRHSAPEALVGRFPDNFGARPYRRGHATNCLVRGSDSDGRLCQRHLLTRRPGRLAAPEFGSASPSGDVGADLRTKPSLTGAPALRSKFAPCRVWRPTLPTPTLGSPMELALDVRPIVFCLTSQSLPGGRSHPLPDAEPDRSMRLHIMCSARPCATASRPRLYATARAEFSCPVGQPSAAGYASRGDVDPPYPSSGGPGVPLWGPASVRHASGTAFRPSPSFDRPSRGDGATRSSESCEHVHHG